MRDREEKIQLWFDMWLKGADLGILELFDPAAAYIESWGPEYRGARAIRHWFEEWNTRGRVLRWDILQYFHKGNQTVVEWRFHCAIEGGPAQEFDGLSLVEWSGAGQIRRLQEFGCNRDRYDPYQSGPAPRFRDEKSLWF